MSADAPQRNEGDAFDVVLMHGPTQDGQGTRVIRARPGRLDAGEVRPMREGRPLTAGGEVVRLEQRPNAPALFDVHVECAIPGSPPEASPGSNAQAQGGPAQVATREYRENWDVTFGAVRGKPN